MNVEIGRTEEYEVSSGRLGSLEQSMVLFGKFPLMGVGKGQHRSLWRTISGQRLYLYRPARRVSDYFDLQRAGRLVHFRRLRAAVWTAPDPLPA